MDVRDHDNDPAPGGQYPGHFGQGPTWRLEMLQGRFADYLIKSTFPFPGKIMGIDNVGDVGEFLDIDPDVPIAGPFIARATPTAHI